MPDAARSRLDEQLVPYRAAHPDARWLAPASWHLTLLFLGAVPEVRVPELVSLVDSVAAELTPFEVTIDDGGGRVRHGEGVAWLRVGKGAGRVIDAASLVAAECPPGVTAGPPPRRTPSAHLTVARRADDALVSGLENERLGPLRADWTIDRVVLMRSHLGRDGARYEALHEATLYAAAERIRGAEEDRRDTRPAGEEGDEPWS